MFSQDSAGEPLYKLFKAIKHQVEKGPVDAKMKKAKYTLNDTGLLGDDVEYSILVSTVISHNAITWKTYFAPNACLPPNIAEIVGKGAVQQKAC